MPLSVDDFTQRLTSSGLMSSDTLADFVSNQPAQVAADGESLARALVKQKKLTAYQAQCVYAGKTSGLVLGNYVVLDKLGQGGMGMVLKAEHRRMKRVVALKVLSPTVTKTKDLLQRFQREVEAAARLTHPNIVAAFDADVDQGIHYLVMEFVDGRDLSSVVKESGPMSLDRAIDCMIQAARGLEFAHKQGVIHRDIKPSNLLLAADGQVKILDMGLARLSGGANESGAGADLTNTGAVMGTVDYMSPEQALNTKRANERSDVYSLGCTLWYLLAGRSMFDGETLMEKLLSHRETAAPSLMQIAQRSKGKTDASDAQWKALDSVFQKMVAKKPDQRYASMSELLADLERCRSGEPVAAVTIAAPATDSRFTEFLAGLEAIERPGTPTAATRATDSSPNTNASTDVGSSGGRSNTAFEATVTYAMDSASDTDPTSHLTASKQRTGGTRPVKKSPVKAAAYRNWIMGGVAALVLLLGFGFLFIPPRRADKPSHAITKAEGIKASPSSKASDSSSDPSAAVGNGYELSFRDGGRVTMDSLLINLNEPLTIEGYVTPSNQSGQQAPLFAFDLINVRTEGGKWWAWVWTASGSDNLPSDLAVLPGLPVHVAIVVDGQQVRLYVDGRQVTLPARSAARLSSALKPFELGYQFNGSVDEVRVSRSVRYRENFLPQTRFTPDKDTLALYHCDEGTGDELRDSSGNRHHGKIVGAKWATEERSAPDLFCLDFHPEQDSGVLLPIRYDGTHPLTAEAWVEVTDFALKDGHQNVIADSSGGGFHLGILNAGPCWKCPISSMSRGITLQPSEKIVGHRKTHVALIIDSTTSRLFVNGRLLEARDLPGGYKPSSAKMCLGKFPGGAGLAGKLYEVRLSKSIRYSSDFVPKSRFERDPDTWALYHFDEGSGDELKDSSGHGHHGKIVGATWAPTRGADSSPTDGWTSLFNGRDLAGWKPLGRNGWTVANGVLIGETTAKDGNGWLMSDREFGDYEIELEYKLSAGSNSGLFVRAWPEGDVSGGQFLEVQMLDDLAPAFAKIPPDRRTASLFGKAGAQPPPNAAADQWHRMLARVSGERVQVTFNDVPVLDHSVQGLRPKGHIGLQLYPSRLEFRKVRVREVPSETKGSPAVNLLSQIDIARDVTVGPWTLENGVLRTTAAPNGANRRLTLPVTKLPQEYDVRLKVERTSNRANAFVLGIVIDSQRTALVMDGYSSRGGLWGLEMIDGKGPIENGTAVSKEPLQVGVPAEVLVQVRKSGITVDRDGRKIINWIGTPQQLSLNSSWNDSQSPRLFLGAQGEFVIHRLEIVPVSGAALVSDASSKSMTSKREFIDWVIAQPTRKLGRTMAGVESVKHDLAKTSRLNGTSPATR